jgi:5-formyltetrahydrofolate cyclo-ligase
MTRISDQKSAARKSAFAKRKLAHGQGLDQAANNWLLGYIAMHPQAQVIAGYMPIRTEINPLAAMTVMHGQGRRICVPVVLGEAQPLEFREWTPDADMQEGAFGASIPVDGAVLVPDLVITPLLAWDREGYRLGYGGGFYDRSFEQMRKRRPTLGVGFAYSAQEVPKVPREATDQPLDALVTENDIHFFG